jgi:hypothetical protein
MIVWAFIVNMVLGTVGVQQTYFQFLVGPFNSQADCIAAQAAFNVYVAPPIPGVVSNITAWEKTPCVQR